MIEEERRSAEQRRWRLSWRRKAANHEDTRIVVLPLAPMEAVVGEVRMQSR